MSLSDYFAGVPLVLRVVCAPAMCVFIYVIAHALVNTFNGLSSAAKFSSPSQLQITPLCDDPHRPVIVKPGGAAQWACGGLTYDVSLR